MLFRKLVAAIILVGVAVITSPVHAATIDSYTLDLNIQYGSHNLDGLISIQVNPAVLNPLGSHNRLFLVNYSTLSLDGTPALSDPLLPFSTQNQIEWFRVQGDLVPLFFVNNDFPSLPPNPTIFSFVAGGIPGEATGGTVSIVAPTPIPTTLPLFWFRACCANGICRVESEV